MENKKEQPYSLEQYRSTEKELNKANTEIRGDKSVEELRGLIDKKESLENERTRLLDDAYTEARLINILYDVEGKYPFEKDSGADIFGWVSDYYVQAEKYAGELKRDDLKETLRVAEETLLNLFASGDKEWEEADFETLTDTLDELQQIHTEREALKGGTTAPEGEERIEEEEHEEIIKKVQTTGTSYKKGGKYKGRFYSPSMFVHGIDEYDQEVRAYIDKDMRMALGISQLTQSRRDLIERHRPHTLRFVEHWGKDNIYYRVVPDDLEKWAHVVQAELPKVKKPQEGPEIEIGDIEVDEDDLEKLADAEIKVIEIKEPLLPEGEWPEGEPDEESETGGRKREVSVSDPERVRFLRSLGPIEKIIAPRAFGSNRVYTGFVFVRNGERVAVIATDKTDNGDYVFWAEDPDYLEIARASKLEILRNYNNLPSFAARLIHKKDWRSRLREFLAGEREVRQPGGEGKGRMGQMKYPFPRI